MRSVIFGLGLCAVVLAAPSAGTQFDPSIAQVYSKYPAPIGHRQPSVADVERARSGRATDETDLNEIARQIEGNLRARLRICRGC